jgi:2,3-bisphosphoglycerate-independent phosphoglycerate mutase
VYQELQRINVAVREGELARNPELLRALNHARIANKPVHLIGLVSNGGVHSHINHLKALVDICQQQQLTDVNIHAFTDGRDCDPKSGLGFMTELQLHLNQTVGRIATVSGRYYAMDRDKRWERVKLAYDALVKGVGAKATDAIAAVEQSYAANITDEFILPTVIINEAQQPLATINDGDVVICFNFRTDRCREITEVLTQFDLPDFQMHQLQLDYTTMTVYDQKYRNVHVLFDNDDLRNTIGEVLEANGKTQLRMAETEKYPHVTFFFSGGREKPFEGENRILVPSPKVATYDLQPEMSAFELTAALLPQLEQAKPDFVCINYANADMVGHTGIFSAAIKAVETVDQCVQKVVTTALENGYTVFLTADHGNSDYMINPDGSPNTAHTLNPVPLFVIDREWRGTLKNGKLGDLAPTILSWMGLPVPKEMTGNRLM